jgi:FkbM family methyltransferase
MATVIGEPQRGIIKKDNVVAMPLMNTIKFIITHPLNRDNKFNALLRFAKWQIGSRLVPGNVVCDWVNGAKFLARTGEAGITGNIYTGLHEFTDMAFLLHVLRDDDLFVDVGANVGSYTLLACAAIGAKGYAFEPVPATYKRLVENIRINHLEDRVQYLNIGVGREPATIAFTSDMDTTNHALAHGEQNANEIDVEVTTLDTALLNRSPSLLKIDVEGYETAVLEGATATLGNKALHSVIMELNGTGNRYGFDESRILEMMFDHGFRTFSYNPIEKCLINLEGKNPSSGNTLFIRDEAVVLERIKNSQPVTIYGKPL